MHRKWLKKRKILFYESVLLGNHQRVCITKLLKSLYPTVQCTYLEHVGDLITGLLELAGQAGLLSRPVLHDDAIRTRS
jgi:hypothetical protein